MKLPIIVAALLLYTGPVLPSEPGAAAKSPNIPPPAVSRAEDLLMADNGTVKVGIVNG